MRIRLSSWVGVAGLTGLALGVGSPAIASVETFDGYAPGVNLHGVGGWKGWDNLAGAGAFVSSARAKSGANSLHITGPTDIVRLSNATSGRWTYSADQWIASGSGGASYFILMNTYAEGGNTDAAFWSVQLRFDAGAGKVWDDYRGGAKVALATDQWSTIRVEIDLDANTYESFYNGQLLTAGKWTSGAGSASRIAAVDLYAGTGSAFYDNVALTQIPAPMSAAVMFLGCLTAAGDWRRARA